MSETINVTIKVDRNIKRDAENLFAKLGLTLSTATNVFFRQAVMTQGIPFPIKTASLNENNDGFLLREALRETQEKAVINGTSELTLDEINEIITEIRYSK